jgi:hypothetical protein
MEGDDPDAALTLARPQEDGALKRLAIILALGLALAAVGCGGGGGGDARYISAREKGRKFGCGSSYAIATSTECMDISQEICDLPAEDALQRTMKAEACVVVKLDTQGIE